MSTGEGRGAGSGLPRVVAAVTLHRDAVWGGIPVFLARDEGELWRLAGHVAKVTLGMIHDLENGTLLIVRH